MHGVYEVQGFFLEGTHLLAFGASHTQETNHSHAPWYGQLKERSQNTAAPIGESIACTQ